MFSELIGMESWIIYDFLYFIPIPLYRNKLPQINIYYVNFDKPIIFRNFARKLAFVSFGLRDKFFHAVSRRYNNKHHPSVNTQC